MPDVECVETEKEVSCEKQSGDDLQQDDKILSKRRATEISSVRETSSFGEMSAASGMEDVAVVTPQKKIRKDADVMETEDTETEDSEESLCNNSVDKAAVVVPGKRALQLYKARFERVPNLFHANRLNTNNANEMVESVSTKILCYVR